MKNVRLFNVLVVVALTGLAWYLYRQGQAPSVGETQPVSAGASSVPTGAKLIAPPDSFTSTPLPLPPTITPAPPLVMGNRVSLGIPSSIPRLGARSFVVSSGAVKYSA